MLAHTFNISIDREIGEGFQASLEYSIVTGKASAIQWDII